MNVFNTVRNALLDPSDKGIRDRKEIAQVAGVAKIESAAGCALFGLLTLLSASVIRTNPVTGGLFFVMNSIGGLTSIESYQLAKNIEKLVGGNGALGNLFQRVYSSYSPEQLVREITKDTLVVGPLLGSTLVRALQQAHPD